MNIVLSLMNYGKLKERVKAEKNIVYYRRGFEELSLNITNACPNACAFCIRDRNQGWGDSNLYLQRDPTVEEVIGAYNREYEKIVKSGVDLKKVKICGYGEPILRFDDLKLIAKHIRKKGSKKLKIQITTTGWPYFKFVSPESQRIGELKESGLTDVYLGLSTPYKEVYRKLVKPGVNKYEPFAFENSIRFGIAAKEAGLIVTLGFINLAGIKEEDARSIAKKLRMAYKIREFEK